MLRNTSLQFVHEPHGQEAIITGYLEMYGDFGRYIFQANVEDFRNVSISDAYYYAMDYIFSVLGYKDELFSKYDSRRGGVDRFANKRTERIGKKYQWST